MAADPIVRIVLPSSGIRQYVPLSSLAAIWASRGWVLDTLVENDRLVTANTGTAYSIDPAAGSAFNLTLTGNVTFALIAPAAACSVSVRVKLTQDATGGRTVTWPASVKWGNGLVPVTSTAAGKVDRYVFETSDGGVTWYGDLLGVDYR